MRQPDWTSDDGRVVLYCGDCLEILPELAPDSVDVIWTDPPYGHNNNNNGDLIARWEAALGVGKYVPGETDIPILNDGPVEMRAVVDGMLKEASRILKRDCCCCCCCGGGGPKPTFAWLAERMDREGLSFFHSVIWDKGGLGMGWRYRRNHEMVMIAHRRGGKLKWETKDKGEKTANVVRIGKIIPQKTDHPTPKPVELIEHFLSLHCKPDDLVLDPFGGRFPVAIACLHLGLRFIGIELDKEHFAKGRDRIQCEIVSVRNSLPLTFEQPPQQMDILEAHE